MKSAPSAAPRAEISILSFAVMGGGQNKFVLVGL